MLQLNGRTIQRARIPSPPIGSFALTTTTTKRGMRKNMKPGVQHPTPHKKKTLRNSGKKKDRTLAEAFHRKGNALKYDRLLLL
jgi:hypothetical protein